MANLPKRKKLTNVQDVLNKVISTGLTYLHLSANIFYTGEYDGEIVEVSTRIVDGVMRIVDALVKMR